MFGTNVLFNAEKMKTPDPPSTNRENLRGKTELKILKSENIFEDI